MGFSGLVSHAIHRIMSSRLLNKLASFCAPHALGGGGHVDIDDAKRRQRIHHRVHDRRRRANGPGLAAALGAQRTVLRVSIVTTTRPILGLMRDQMLSNRVVAIHVWDWPQCICALCGLGAVAGGNLGSIAAKLRKTGHRVNKYSSLTSGTDFRSLYPQ